jgi:hypothetical protein
VVEDKIFKFKHRQMADDPSTFNRRMKRVVDRFWTRAESREGSHIFDIYKKDEIEASVGQAALDPTSYKTTAMDETNAHREYVVKESVAQYKDYYQMLKRDHSLNTSIIYQTVTEFDLWKFSRTSPQ